MRREARREAWCWERGGEGGREGEETTSDEHLIACTDQRGETHNWLCPH